MRHEAEIAKFGPGYGRRKGRSSGGAKFGGFKEKDFSGGVTGTTWRTQKALGGAVTALLNSDRPQMKSRAVARMPEVHWTDPDRVAGDNRLPAKLFVRLDKEFVYYGFSVERSDDKSQGQDDWHGFIEWLSDTKNESWLREIVDEYGLCVFDQKDTGGSFDGRIVVGDENWRLALDKADQEVPSLAGFLKELPETATVDLQIAKISAKQDALARAGEITGDISSLFATLMPLYRAALSQPDE
jgi:hypothetical protein